MSVRLLTYGIALLVVLFGVIGTSNAATIGQRSHNQQVAAARGSSDDDLDIVSAFRQAYEELSGENSDEDDDGDDEDEDAEHHQQALIKQQQQQHQEDSQEDSDEEDNDDDDENVDNDDDQDLRRRRRDTAAVDAVADAADQKQPETIEAEAAVPKPETTVDSEKQGEQETTAATPPRKPSVLILIRDTLKKVTSDLPTQQVTNNALQYFQLFEHFLQQTIEQVIGGDDDDEDDEEATTIKSEVEGASAPAITEDAIKAPEAAPQSTEEEAKPAAEAKPVVVEKPAEVASNAV